MESLSRGIVSIIRYIRQHESIALDPDRAGLVLVHGQHGVLEENRHSEFDRRLERPEVATGFHVEHVPAPSLERPHPDAAVAIADEPVKRRFALRARLAFYLSSGSASYSGGSMSAIFARTASNFSRLPRAARAARASR